MGTQMKPGKPPIDRMRAIEDRIVKGYVLNEQGNWVTIEQRRKVEEEVLAHLTAGRILHEGKWLDFDSVKALRSHRQEIAPAVEEEETREFKI